MPTTVSGLGAAPPPARYRPTLSADYRRSYLAALVRGASLLQRLAFLSFSHGLTEAVEAELLRQVIEVVEAEEEHGSPTSGAAAGAPPRETEHDILSSAAVLFGGESYHPQGTYFADAWLWLQVESEASTAAAVDAQEREALDHRARILYARQRDQRQLSLARGLIFIAALWLVALAAFACRMRMLAGLLLLFSRAARRLCCCCSGSRAARPAAGAGKHAQLAAA